MYFYVTVVNQPTHELLLTGWQPLSVILLLANEQCFNHSIRCHAFRSHVGREKERTIMNQYCILLTLSISPREYNTCHYYLKLWLCLVIDKLMHWVEGFYAFIKSLCSYIILILYKLLIIPKDTYSHFCLECQSIFLHIFL